MSATASVCPEVAKGKGKRTRSEYAKKFAKKRHYFFMCTWHNVDEPLTIASFRKVPGKEIGVKAYVYQLEIAPSTKKPHFQAYIEFLKQVSINEIRASMGLNSTDEEGAYFEPRKGTHRQAFEYCTKLETRAIPTADPITFGEFTKKPDGTYVEQELSNSEARDFDAMEALRRGSSVNELVETHALTFLYNRTNLFHAKMAMTKPRDHPVEVIVVYGTTGSGKSRWAKEHFPGAYDWQPPVTGRQDWWDGYEGQETIIVNEFYGQLPWDRLLTLLDRYGLKVQVKGGHAEMVCKRIVFTSNCPPENWYINQTTADGSACDFQILRRRITKAFAIQLDLSKAPLVEWVWTRMSAWECPTTNEDIFEFHKRNAERNPYCIFKK